MSYKDLIIMRFANSACDQIADNVIRDIRKISDGMLSGADSPLKNIWDEVCVQRQTDFSIMWEAYLDTINPMIKQELVKLDEETLQAIWLQTQNGSDWDNEHEDDWNCLTDKVEVDEEDIAEYILQVFILEKAAKYTNKRIEKFIENDYDL